ncbi:MAG: 3-hydroxybutyrate dehydrogenase [Solirubrobacteraceae bacterium]
MKLEGITALVTGANRGIGAAIAARLADAGVGELLCGMREPAAHTPPPGARAVRMDLSSRESIEECCAELGPDLQRIDLLINNAGVMTGGLLEEQAMDQVYAMFQVNLLAVAHLTARVLPGMLERGRGKVVNNASISGYAFFPAATTYAASKAGVVALTEALRRELQGTGVSTLHLITPGVNTGMLDDTEEVYGRHIDTSSWEKQEPDEWAGKVIEAIRDDARTLSPGGRVAWAVRASHGPPALLDAISSRMFSRKPRR